MSNMIATRMKKMAYDLSMVDSDIRKQVSDEYEDDFVKCDKCGKDMPKPKGQSGNDDFANLCDDCYKEEMNQVDVEVENELNKWRESGATPEQLKAYKAYLYAMFTDAPDFEQKERELAIIMKE